jgi:hypothetical protein
VLRWTAPQQVDRGRTKVGLTRLGPRSRVPAARSLRPASALLHGGIPITGVSCPTALLCVVVDLNGNALTTRTPRRPRSWRRFPIDSAAPLNGVSCPSTRFCAAIDTMGGVVTSNDPTGGPSAWTRVIVRRAIRFDASLLPVPLSSVSCASAHLCVSGGDDPGEIMTSTDPTGGVSAWRDRIGLGARHRGAGLVSVSCPSTRFCASVGDEAVYATTAPTRRGSTTTAVAASLESIACGSRALCVAVVGGQQEGGGRGGVWRSTDPAGGRPEWSPTRADDDEQFAVACHGRRLCVATDSAGRVTMSGQPAAADPRWQTRRVDRTDVLSGISCPTDRLCVVGDTYGYVVVGRR